jgi:hypothetical protein
MAVGEFIPIRASAAAQSLGAPKVAGISPQRTTKGVARLPRAAKAKIPGVHAAPKGQAKSPAKAIAKAQPAKQAKSGPGSTPRATTFDPATHGLYGPGELQNIARSEEGQAIKSQLAPLKAQGQEVQQIGRTVGNRYAQAGKITEGTLQGLSQQAEGNAKTYENEVAQNAANASKEINTTGQNAANNNAGYVDPQVRAALAAGAERTTQANASGNQFAQTVGANENNYMANIRAAAAQRIGEGQANIADTYGKQYGQVVAKEGALTEKLPELAKTRAGQLGEKQETEALTRAGLNIKGETLQQKAKESTAKNQVTERGQNLKTRETQERVKATERGQTLAQYRNAENNKVRLQTSKEKDEISRTNNIEKVKASLEKTANKASPTLNKLTSELGSAYTTIQELRSGKSPAPNPEIREILTRGKEVIKRGGKTVKETVPKVTNQTLITAAMELWDYHAINSHTAAALTAMGMKVPPEWTNGSFKGF